MTIKIGDKVADFALPSTAGEFSLGANAGKIVVLYFYPKDDTPGCTIESGEFSALLPEFEAAGALTLGVSRDNLQSHEAFRQKFNYAHHLLVDSNGELCERFGVWGEKTQFGKTFFGIIRGTFIIDGGGRLAAEWRNIKETRGHAAQVLQKTREIAAACAK